MQEEIDLLIRVFVVFTMRGLVRERYLNPIHYSVCSAGFCMVAMRAA